METTTIERTNRLICRKAKELPFFQKQLSGGRVESIGLYSGTSTSISIDCKGIETNHLGAIAEWVEISELQYSKIRTIAIGKILKGSYSLPEDEISLICPHCKSRNVTEIQITHGEAYCEYCNSTMDIAKCIEKMDYETANTI